MKIKSGVNAVIGLISLPFLLLTACEDTSVKDDLSGIPANSSGYVSVEGDEEALIIKPDTITVPAGNKTRIQFTAVGGLPPYQWSVSVTEYGRIDQRGSYVSERGTNTINDVIVIDAQGRAAYASVNQN